MVTTIVWILTCLVMLITGGILGACASISYEESENIRASQSNPRYAREIRGRKIFMIQVNSNQSMMEVHVAMEDLENPNENDKGLLKEIVRSIAASDMAFFVCTNTTPEL